MLIAVSQVDLFFGIYMNARVAGKTGVSGDAGHPCPAVDAAAVAFIRSYKPGIDWVINSAKIPQEDRKDLVQDITIKVLRRFRKHGVVHSDGSNLSYAISVARSCAFTYLKLRRRNGAPHLDGTAVERVRCTDMLPDDQAIRNDGHARLRYAIASLSPLRRYVVERYMAGATPTEIARDHECKVEFVKTAHHRAVQQLRKRLVPR